jgi:RimJ/RimL family protein N-acetyltransferase
MENWRIVPATPEDALRLSHLLGKLESESDFMMYEAHEVPTEDLLYRRLETSAKNKKETFLLAIADNGIYGYALVFRGNLTRNRGVGTLALGVAGFAQGCGVGSSLIAEAVAWAKRQGLYRLQLQVQTNNTKALHLYQKLGFKNEGMLHRCAFVNGQHVNKFQMALLL